MPRRPEAQPRWFLKRIITFSPISLSIPFLSPRR